MFPVKAITVFPPNDNQQSCFPMRLLAVNVLKVAGNAALSTSCVVRNIGISVAGAHLTGEPKGRIALIQLYECHEIERSDFMPRW